MKNVLSIALLLAILMSMLSVPAYAQDAPGGEVTPAANDQVLADPATNPEAYQGLLYLSTVSNDTYPRMVVLKRETHLQREFCWAVPCGPNEIVLGAGATLFVLGQHYEFGFIPWGWDVQMPGNPDNPKYYTPGRTWD